MTFEEYWGEDPDPGKITAKHAWNAGQAAEREKYADLIAAAEAVVDEDDKEPYAWVAIHDHHGFDALYFDRQEAVDDGHSFVWPLYRHPQPKARLTDEEISQVGEDSRSVEGNHILPFAFARAIEQKIWEKAE